MKKHCDSVKSRRVNESRRDRAKRVLEPSHQKKRIETEERLKAGILRLKEKNIPVTRYALWEETRDRTTDPPTAGIHPSTIGRRQELLDLVEEAQGVTYPAADLSDVSLNHLRAGRVLARVLVRLKAEDHVKLAKYTLVLEEEVIALRQEKNELQLLNISLERKRRALEQTSSKRRGATKKGSRRGRKAVRRISPADEDEPS